MDLGEIVWDSTVIITENAVIYVSEESKGHVGVFLIDLFGFIRGEIKRNLSVLTEILELNRRISLLL